MNKKDLFVCLLVALTTALFIYLGIWGERINSAEVLELVVLIPFVLAPLVLFLWMGGHCILNNRLQPKWPWILLLIFTSYVGSLVYYLFVYRKSEGLRHPQN